MASRGIRQLKYVRMFFCDWGGSSAGVREALKSEKLASFVQNNQHIRFEFFLRRNHHPYVSSVFQNGYVKEQPLRSMEPAEVLEWLTKVNSEFGRRPISHSGKKNLTEEAASIQGPWRHDLWN